MVGFAKYVMDCMHGRDEQVQDHALSYMKIEILMRGGHDTTQMYQLESQTSLETISKPFHFIIEHGLVKQENKFMPSHMQIKFA